MICDSCGCTEDNACVAEDGVTTCGWVAPHKCSACYPTDPDAPEFRRPVEVRRVA